MGIRISELKRRVRIADVIGRSVRLREHQGLLRGLCPFHGEDTPSFYVFEVNPHYHCFGCGAHGDVVNWICETQSKTVGEAVKLLSGENVWDVPILAPLKIQKPKRINAATQKRYDEFKGVVFGEHHVTAKSLGVSLESLLHLGAAWSVAKRAMLFPMFNAKREIIGFRFRANNGAKWSMKGGYSGLFIPDNFEANGTLYLPEGPTDTAALLTLGINNVIGRPAALGCFAMIREFVKLNTIGLAIIIADNDKNNIGFDGAKKLSEEIGIASRIVRTKAKDIRASLKAGLTREQFLAAVQ